MQVNTGIIKVIRLDLRGGRSAQFRMSDHVLPIPGTYFLAHHHEDKEMVIGATLFPVGLESYLTRQELVTLGPIPKNWEPGTKITLIGPIGHGYHVPENTNRVALAAFGDTLARLLPLITPAVETGADVVLFCDENYFPDWLPAAVEIYPLSSLAENLSWASYLAMDMPLEDFQNLHSMLKLGPHDEIPYPAQVLIQVPMPCGAVADCGVCAVPARKGGYKLTCKEGPVFDLAELVW